MNKTPFELYCGFKPSVRHLKPFGSVAYIGIPRQKRNKLEAKAKRGILVGYAFRTRGYRIWIEDTNSIVETCNVSFDENLNYKSFSNGAVLGPGSDSFLPIGDDGSGRETIVEEDSNTAGPSNIPTDSTLSDSGEDDSSSEDDPGVKHVKWYRRAVPRTKSKRVDIFYYEENKKERLRSLEDVRKYCDRNSIHFKPEIFDFKGNNHFTGIVSDDDESSDSDVNLIQPQA